MREAELIAVDKEPIVGLPKDVLMQKFKDRPVTLAFQIAPENVPSTMLKLTGKDPGGVESHIWDQTEGFSNLLIAASDIDRRMTEAGM